MNRQATHAEVKEGNVVHHFPNRETRRKREFPRSSKIAHSSKTNGKIYRNSKHGVSKNKLRSRRGKIKAFSLKQAV